MHTMLPVAPSQRICPQHCVDVVQVVPKRWQHCAVVGEGAQRSPVQQSVSMRHVESPTGRHIAAARHTLAMHVVPVQQSLLSTHDCPSVRHAHVPVVVLQSI